jgi:hypothetical protein
VAHLAWVLSHGTVPGRRAEVAQPLSALSNNCASAPLGFEQQLRLSRSHARHQPVHLGHIGCLIPGRSGHLLRIGAVSLPLSCVTAAERPL